MAICRSLVVEELFAYGEATAVDGDFAAEKLEFSAVESESLDAGHFLQQALQVG